MNKLEKLAIRIGKISEEIKKLKSQREVNLEHCHGFDSTITDIENNCLYRAYEMVKEQRKDAYNYANFDDVIENYGCTNCAGAHKAKRKIGTLKQERGRIVGNISTIGKSLNKDIEEY